MASMVGAMVIMGIQPGPQMMTSNPALFWGLITSMWVGNLMLVILNLPLIGIWVKSLTVPYRFLLLNFGRTDPFHTARCPADRRWANGRRKPAAPLILTIG